MATRPGSYSTNMIISMEFFSPTRSALSGKDSLKASCLPFPRAGLKLTIKLYFPDRG
jgi:hypothetical protein